MSADKLEIRYVPLERVVLWDRNPKKHDLDSIVNSIERHGFRDAPIFDETLGGLAAGNGRTVALRSMQEAGYDPPRGIALDSDGQWLVPVQFGVDATTRSQAESFAVDHNNLTIVGFEALDVMKIWEADEYALLLESMAHDDWLPTTVDVDDFEQITRVAGSHESGGNAGADTEPEIDQAEELRREWGVETGQMWQCGPHRIVCGDCTDADTVSRLMDGERAALVHADPPYGMGKERDGIANDNLYRDKLDEFQMQWWTTCRPHIADNGSVYIWGYAEDLWRLWYVGGLQDGERLTFRSEIVWVKGIAKGIGSGSNRVYAPATERCIFFMIGEQGFNHNADNYWDGWEPIRLYLKEQRDLMGWDIAKCKSLAGHSPTSGCHWFDASQWSFVTRDVYESWQRAAGGEAFQRDYDELKKEHDELKKEHDELKKEFYSARAYFDNTHENMTDVWEFHRVSGDERHGHATPKPVEMVERAIVSSCAEGGMVYVPFSGTAPEMIAAHNRGRVCRAVEISPEYVAVALDRYHRHTGIKPEIIV